MDFLAQLRSESARFGEVLRTCDPAAQVPTCPDWNAADLLWHLTEVQQFWAAIVHDRMQSPNSLADPERPGEYAELLSLFEATATALADTLAGTSDDVEIWTWSADHTAGFVRRRQAHEALIHRLDAELTAGAVTALDPELAADGVDEVLRCFYGNRPPWARWAPDGPVGRVQVTDRTGDWTFRMGGLSGTSPATQREYTDYPGLELIDGGTASFTVSGTARDLDAWLWKRPTLTAVTIEGDAQRFLDLVDDGIQ